MGSITENPGSVPQSRRKRNDAEGGDADAEEHRAKFKLFCL